MAIIDKERKDKKLQIVKKFKEGFPLYNYLPIKMYEMALEIYSPNTAKQAIITALNRVWKNWCKYKKNYDRQN